MEHIFDSHAHYFDARFERETEAGADALLDRIMPSPVEFAVNVSTNPQNAALAIAQAKRHAGMFAAVGIHPEDCHFIDDPDRALAQLEALLGDAESRRRDKLVALGEIGLDYHWQSYDNGRIPMDKGKQAYFFEAQLAMAEAHDLPVIIHDREAHGDCFAQVLRHPRVRGVFHSYSGSAEMAKELTRRGWYVSFSGPLTFANAARLREIPATLPRERILVETDAPYLAPHPHRGRINHSALLVHTLEVLAELLRLSPEEAAILTAQNAKKLFSLP